MRLFYDEIIPISKNLKIKNLLYKEKIYNGEDLTVEEQAFR